MWTAIDIVALALYHEENIRFGGARRAGHAVAWLAARKWLHMREFIDRSGLYDTEAAVARYRNMRLAGVLSPGARVPKLRPW